MAAKLPLKLNRDFSVIRMTTEIPNHIYSVVIGSDQAMMDKKLTSTVQYTIRDNDDTARIIIYCMFKNEIDYIKSLLNGIDCEIMTGDCTTAEKDRAAAVWDGSIPLSGKHVQVMICTDTFREGFHYYNVVLVVHYVAFKNFLSKIQADGRGGRNGRRCNCIVFTCHDLLSKRLSSSRRGNEYFEAIDSSVADWMTDSSTCRRLKVLAYNDGIPNTCMLIPGAELCDNCIRLRIEAIGNTGAKFAHQSSRSTSFTKNSSLVNTVNNMVASPSHAVSRSNSSIVNNPNRLSSTPSRAAVLNSSLTNSINVRNAVFSSRSLDLIAADRAVHFTIRKMWNQYDANGQAPCWFHNPTEPPQYHSSMVHLKHYFSQILTPRPSVFCYNCLSRTHWSNACPMKAKGSNPAATCFMCKRKLVHFASNELHHPGPLTNCKFGSHKDNMLMLIFRLLEEEHDSKKLRETFLSRFGFPIPDRREDIVHWIYATRAERVLNNFVLLGSLCFELKGWLWL
jgi:hypothetical protein